MQKLQKVVKACYDGGVRAFEFTNRGDFARCLPVVKFAAKECPEIAMGVGSVVDPATAALYIQLGANFVVGPLFNPEICKVCNRRLVASLRDAEACLKWVSLRNWDATYARFSRATCWVRNW